MSLLAFPSRRPVLGRRRGRLEEGSGGRGHIYYCLLLTGIPFFSSKLSFILFILSVCTCICSQLSSMEMLKVVGERLEENGELVEDYMKNLV